MKEYIIAFECPVTENSERIAYQVQQKLVGELIRCKDCKWHWRVTEFRASGYCENDKCWDGFHFETDNDFYCGYAERKEE